MKACRGFECGFNEKTFKLAFYVLTTVLMLIGFARLFFAAKVLGLALAILTVLACILGLVSAMLEISWLMFGYLIICVFYFIMQTVNLIVEVIEKEGAVAYGFDVVMLFFYASCGITGLFLYKFFKENDMSHLGLHEYV
eukprot:TRINITY_DN13198_c0_g1_i1.p1 TRINITY_DN13198_c0_g1~~TRINITY_DN13198_c0_g1_i1.p1  ORF type:complete len:139 (-),score=28.58 TRINITY_DN13198_c0_g1_i1:80-496(-)